MIQAINSVLATLCPLLVNQPDVARYATDPKQATWSQATGILISKVVVMFVSCATTSASSGFLGKSYWVSHQCKSCLGFSPPGEEKR